MYGKACEGIFCHHTRVTFHSQGPNKGIWTLVHPYLGVGSGGDWSRYKVLCAFCSKRQSLHSLSGFLITSQRYFCRLKYRLMHIYVSYKIRVASLHKLVSSLNALPQVTSSSCTKWKYLRALSNHFNSLHNERASQHLDLYLDLGQ